MPRSRSLERGAAELSREARKRLAWFDYFDSHGRNVALTCCHFGISRQAFHRWKPRYDRRDLSTLEDRSRRPRHRRQPTWAREQAERVRRLREQYPRWGKDKLAVLLRREGWAVSVSMVGRILTSLRQRGVLREPRVFRVKRRRGMANRPLALRNLMVSLRHFRAALRLRHIPENHLLRTDDSSGSGSRPQVRFHAELAGTVFLDNFHPLTRNFT